jgi:hypothetical protein
MLEWPARAFAMPRLAERIMPSLIAKLLFQQTALKCSAAEIRHDSQSGFLSLRSTPDIRSPGGFSLRMFHWATDMEASGA